MNEDLPATIGLPPERNPEYYKLLADFTPIIERWQDHNLRISLYRVPKGRIPKLEPKLAAISQEYEQLTADSNRWLKRSEDFLRKHPPTLGPGDDGVLSILSVWRDIDKRQAALSQLKHMMHYGIRQHAESIEQRKARHRDRIGLVVGFVSVILAIVGLYFGLS